MSINNREVKVKGQYYFTINFSITVFVFCTGTYNLSPLTTMEAGWLGLVLAFSVMAGSFLVFMLRSESDIATQQYSDDSNLITDTGLSNAFSWWRVLLPISLSGHSSRGIKGIRYSSAILNHPPSKSIIIPILSFRHILNKVVIPNTVCLFLGFLIFRKTIEISAAQLLAISGIAILTHALVFMSKDVWSIKNALLANKKQKLLLVEMNYSLADVYKELESSKLPLVVIDMLDRIELTELTIDAMEISNRLNDLLSGGHVSVESRINDIETLTYLVNEFFIKTSVEVQLFFNKNKRDSNAVGYFYENIIGPLIDKTSEYKETLKRLDKELRVIERRVREFEAEIEAKVQYDNISTRNELLDLIEKPSSEIAKFPEYDLLKFDRIENELLANRIMSDNLPRLNKALVESNSPEQKQRIENMIARCKTFIRSIASNTKEAKERNMRLDVDLSDDPLYLEASKTRSFDDIDNMLSIEQRYLDSYDETLPKTTNQPIKD